MDFFAAQARARQQSRVLGWGFAACVAAVVLALNAVVLSALRVAYSTGRNAEPFEGSLLAWTMAHPGTVLLVSLATAGFIGVAAFTRHLQLREGGGFVARSVGGVRVERSTPDPRRRQLYNVVEEMALASGVPVPEVYVLEKEEGINAFAAGHTTSNAAVAVTRGALLHLKRDQLQGVIAHEFSHILNGDMRISIRLMSMVFGLMAVSLAGRLLLRLSASSRGGSGRDRGVVPLLLVGAAIAIIGQIGFWAGRILQAWISRKRECLADASAVQFTRHPDGLRDALLRIAASGSHRPSSSGMEEIAHMLLVPDARRLLATHPPLETRVRELDPHVTPERFASLVRQAREQMKAEKDLDPLAAQPAGPPTTATLASSAVPAAAALIVATTGEPAPRHLEQAIAVRRALPESLRASAEKPEDAQALLLAMIVFTNQAPHDTLIALVRERHGSTMAGAVQRAAEATSRLAPVLRLPAVLQLIPALRALPLAERVHYVATLRELIRVDGGISVFEFALEKLATRALLPRESVREPHGRQALDDVPASLGIVFAVLARHGAADDEKARRAYESGIAPLLPLHRPGYSVIADWVAPFDTALEELCRLRVTAKQMLIEGLVRTIAHDDLLAPAEAELLRAICAVLECPLPPLLLPTPQRAGT